MQHESSAESVSAGYTISARWGTPYISDATGKPTVLTKDPVPKEQILFGLHSYLSADTLGELVCKMRDEDEKYQRFLDDQGG